MEQLRLLGEEPAKPAETRRGVDRSRSLAWIREIRKVLDRIEEGRLPRAS